MSNDEGAAQASDDQAASPIVIIDRQIEQLAASQQVLDANGFTLTSIHINEAIETLRAERVKLTLSW